MGFGILAGAALLGSKKGKDLLLGKKDKGRKAGHIGLDESLAASVENSRKVQARAAKVYGKELDSLGQVDAQSAARREQARRIQLARQMGEDQKMKARETMARSGTQRSAVGMRSLMGAENRSLESIRGIRADMPQIMQQQQMQRLGRLGQISGGVNRILQAPGAQRAYDKGRKGKGRSGGLLKLGLMAGGAIAGGMAGGPGGAAAGMQMGSGAGSTLANM